MHDALCHVFVSFSETCLCYESLSSPTKCLKICQVFSLTHAPSTWPLQWVRVCQKKMILTVRKNWQLKELCVLSVHADWLIMACHSDVGSTLHCPTWHVLICVTLTFGWWDGCRPLSRCCTCSMTSPQQQYVDVDDEGGDSLRCQVPLHLHEWSAPHLRVGALAISAAVQRGQNKWVLLVFPCNRFCTVLLSV